MAPPDPADLRHLLGGALLAAGLALALFAQHPRAPLGALLLVLAGLGAAPPASAPLWSLAPALLALLALLLAHPDGAGSSPLLPAILMAGAGVLAVTAVTAFLPALSPGALPLVLLTLGLLALAVGGAIALLRHRRDAPDSPAPQG